MSIFNTARFALAAWLGLAASSALAQAVHPDGAAAPLVVTPIFSFSGGNDGSMPASELAVDSDGALYGTTVAGGAYNDGVVFKLTPPAAGSNNWTETVLYSFLGGSNGLNPMFTPTIDSRGVIYGATQYGGANDNSGAAFQLTPPIPPSTQWTGTKIFDFSYASTGANPKGGFVIDSSGALYGTTSTGGPQGKGTVYKLTPPTPPATQWTGAALYSFSGGADGGNPGRTLVIDSSGALYGGTASGGASGSGVVFKLIPPGGNCTPTAPNLWCETVLADGIGSLSGGVVMDSHGALYGAAQGGGAYSHGQLFKLTPPVPPATQWTLATLYSFTGGADGANPTRAPILVGGVLYGTTSLMGNCIYCGAIYELTPPVPPSTQWTETTLWSFATPHGPFPSGLSLAPSNFGLGIAINGAVQMGGGAGGYGEIFTLRCPPRGRQVFGGAMRTACAL
ncbi:choice-of-anchor tandem repeat GloVer-containing protein [Methylocystis heyeri]|uniref:Uncharacterized protein n=1 Tax=Methylocystis heyeri TaxID=391905 RepID=A0A6B8KC80_9HYPH|nr:choice-of-anchor tandem repeat GloVer-containing protein [Methylocystis heyeri]QGM44681.1 hypothetical protein H2LOC_002690 [Methylocystis heyeri]